jgi:pentatricopeptide repeat protein
MDPSHPIIPSLTPSSSTNGKEREAQLSAARAKGLSQLHAALQAGAVDQVWSAYTELRNRQIERDPYTFTSETAVLDGIITPWECHRMIGILANEATKTKAGINRLLRVLADLRGQQRRLLARIERASGTRHASRRNVLRQELQAWDEVLTPSLLHTTLVHIGKSLRSVGLDEIDEVLDQLLTYEANEQSRSQTTFQQDQRLPSPNPSKASSKAKAASQDGLAALRDRVLSPLARSAVKKRLESRRPPVNSPDLATYNTLLDIITRTVRRSSPIGQSTSAQGNDQDDEGDSVAKLTQEERGSHSAQLDASLASKLQRFGLDPEAAPVQLDSRERADRLFHSTLERMQRTSGLEPDAITYNIMISMYSLLDRWDAVRRILRTLADEDMLNIDCVNNALHHWQVRGPLSSSRASDREAGDNGAIESALQVYGQLRQNLVQAELGSHHSTIAYGDADIHPRSKSTERSEAFDASGEAGPLSWPEENEGSGDAHRSHSVRTPANEAVDAVLGMPSVPHNVLPDEVTYAMMINSLARSGRFADAFGVFKDLVSTPTRTQSRSNDDRDEEASYASKAALVEEKKMQPTLAIFVSFFRGFAKYGRPSQAIHYDAEHPERTTWEPVPSSEDGGEVATTRTTPTQQQLELWRIETFQQIFDAFLGFEPEMDPILADRGGGRVRRDDESASRPISTPYGWVSLAEKRRLDAARQAPSPNQLFWILTAIRRVSGDHARWSLAMWSQVVTKFEGAVPSEAAWKGFRLDNRLTRVVEHLQTRLQEEHDEHDEHHPAYDR